MILTLEQLTNYLMVHSAPLDTKPSEALWITLAPEGETHAQSVDYRTPDENILLRVYLDKTGALVGIEILS